jgi:hypothetical protein
MASCGMQPACGWSGACGMAAAGTAGRIAQRLTAPSPCGKGRTAEGKTRPRLLCSEWRRSTIKWRRVLTAHRSNRPATSALLGDAEAGLGIGAGTRDAGDEKEAGCPRWWGSKPRRPATDDTLSVGSPEPFVVRCIAGLAASATLTVTAASPCRVQQTLSESNRVSAALISNARTTRPICREGRGGALVNLTQQSVI